MDPLSVFGPLLTGSLKTIVGPYSLDRIMNDSVAHSLPTKLVPDFFFHEPVEVAKDTRKALVLDLDETLIHTSTFPSHKDIVSLHFEDWESYVHLRPHVSEFLEAVAQMFEVFIFTASTKEYADRILNAICPQIDVMHRYYRDQCKISKKKTEKNLNKFQRPLSEVVLVDDNSHMKDKYPANTLHIDRWNGTPVDNVLMDEILPILRRCEAAKDVRPIIGATKKKIRRVSSIIIG